MTKFPISAQFILECQKADIFRGQAMVELWQVFVNIEQQYRIIQSRENQHTNLRTFCDIGDMLTEG